MPVVLISIGGEARPGVDLGCVGGARCFNIEGAPSLWPSGAATSAPAPASLLDVLTWTHRRPQQSLPR